MAWENIDERLKAPFKVEVSFPAGRVWLPDAQVGIDSWLTSIAETDEELKELNIPRIRFIQNHWPIEKLLELEWDNDFQNVSAVWAMYVGHKAYILFSDRIHYRLVAAIESKDEPSLYRAVIGKLLRNPSFVPRPPQNVKNHRPDLVPDIFEDTAGQVYNPPQPSTFPAHESNLSKLLVGWIGSWIDLPVLGFWHEDEPDSITTSEKGTYVMKYKPSYGDKQREAQKHKKEEEQQQPPNEQAPQDTAKKPEPVQSPGKDKHTGRKEHDAA